MKSGLRFTAMLILLLSSAAFAQYLGRASERERAPQRASLAEFPQQFDGWREIDAQSLGTGQLRELRSDDYISRTYVNEQGTPCYLFIAYYASQRHRQTIHSPQNCVPASGWSMGDHRLHSIGVGRDGASREVNEYVISKDDVKMLAFYWYHGRGRVVASDYWGRIYTVKDAIFLGRTDGALVRVIVPMTKAENAREQARSAGLRMVDSLLQRLSNYVP